MQRRLTDRFFLELSHHQLTQQQLPLPQPQHIRAVMLYAIFNIPICVLLVVELDMSTRTATHDSPERARERARVSSLLTSQNRKTSSNAKNRHSREVRPVSPQHLAAATDRNRHQYRCKYRSLVVKTGV